VGKNILYNGDCLIESDKIQTGTVDLILTDLPYGTMRGQGDSGIYHQGHERHEWDEKIPIENIYEIADRVLRPNGRMILFAQEPFTTEIITKAIPNIPFNYRAIWVKDTLGSFMRSKKAMLYRTEDILIFQKKHIKDDNELQHPLRNWLKETQERNNVFWYGVEIPKLYLESGIAKNIQSAKVISAHKLDWNYKQIQNLNRKHYDLLNQILKWDKSFEEVELIYKKFRENLLKVENEKYPCTFNLWQGGKYRDNLFEYKRDRDNYHPTQKPVLLLEDLIKTFSNENDLVVDLTMGSGSTGVACKNTNRNFIGIEKDEKYFNIAQNRINGTEFKPNGFEKTEERGLFLF